jgi:transcriptional regulator GlxA family with amidase domain
MATKFVFLVLPEIHLMDLAGPDQTIHEAIEYGADFEIEYCGIGELPTSSAGLRLGNQKHFSEIQLKKGDYLIIPGANVSYLLSSDFKKYQDLLDWICTQHENGVYLCSICAGAFVLALCGLLNNIPCTTHFKRTQQLQTLFPQSKVVENILFVEQNGIYTSAGIASGIDLTLYIIEQLKGSYFAHKVARELVIYSRRDGSNTQHSAFMQYRNHIHSGIHNAQDFIIENISQKNSITDLADVASMSERNFTRVFKKETGITVNDFITIIRKETIKNLLKNPDLSKRQIAHKVGLTSEKQLTRLMQNLSKN